MMRPKNKEWIVTNNVYYRDTHEVFGYNLRNKQLDDRKVSKALFVKLVKYGLIEDDGRSELALIRVPQDYKCEYTLADFGTDVYGNCNHVDCNKELKEGDNVITLHEYMFCSMHCLHQEAQLVELGEDEDNC